MSNSKISALTSATTPLAGTETLPIVQSSTTKQVSVANLTAGRAVSMLSGTAGTSPGAVTAPVNSDDLVVQNTGAAGITILSPDANAGRIQFGTVSNNSNVTLYGQYNYGFDLYVNGFIVLHADTTTKDTTWSYGNLIQGTAAKGINFTANTPAAGMTSQLLNWYEEGTWTPSLGGTTTYTQQSGEYTRIGRIVHLRGTLQISVLGTGSTTSVSGLPFNGINKRSSGSCGYYGTTAVNVNQLTPVINSATMSFVSSPAAGTGVTDAPAIFGNGTFIFFTVTYQT
jgi:hypothetical protein